MDKQYYNTVKARHINSKSEMVGKEYTWHLPEKLRSVANVGSLVYVLCVNGNTPAIITEMYREDIEDVGKKYKPVCTVKGSDFENRAERCIDLIGTVWSIKLSAKLTKKLMIVGCNMTSVIMGDGRKVTLNELEKRWTKIR